ncbi:MAG TPA: 50S ribosomal protein L11 methyltransferase [Verrucomicrobiae bacterium]|nr:50S ribosomal protein L11 methyltransferase [Verrucomicrobiae bacterium]
MRSVRPLWRISVVTTGEAEDAVAEALSAMLNRPVSSYFHVKSGTSTVSAICEQRPVAAVRKNIFAALERIKDCGLKTGPGKITIAKLRREDWAESWKRHFKPVEIKLNSRRGELCESLSSQKKLGARVTRPSETAKSLLIKPSWSKRKPRKNQIVVVLDPGLGFGTGQHPTTAFCLHELVRCGKFAARRSFLDIGTGSGILAIAAAKLGYSPVHAFDCDPEAVRIARANARANRVQRKLRITRRDVAELPVHAGKQYNVICANLISTLLVAERRRIAAQLKRGGTLVLAGILKSEFSRMHKMFAELGLKLAAAKTGNEWRSGSFCYGRVNYPGKFE